MQSATEANNDAASEAASEPAYFSTTIVTDEGASVRSAPLPEVTGTPYAAFADEINSNASSKKNIKVRSSAIGEYSNY